MLEKSRQAGTITATEIRDGLANLPPLESFNLPPAVLAVAEEIAVDCDSYGVERSDFEIFVRLVAYWSRVSLSNN